MLAVPKFLIPMAFLLSTLVSAQTTNFLKTFTPTAAYTSTTNYVLGGMVYQGVANINSFAFILGGSYTRYSTAPGDTLTEDAYLIKNQPDGLTKWFRKYHLGGRRLLFYDIGITYNNNVVAVGTANGMNNQLNPDGILMTTDSNGHFKDLRIYPNQAISKVTVLKDKKIALLTSDSNLYLKLVLLDKDGNLIWSKRLQHSDINCCSYKGYELVEGKDKSFLIVGHKFINMTNPSYVWYPFAMLCDSNGNKLNDLVVPIGYSQFLNASNNFDSGFYIVGSGGNTGSAVNLYGHLLKLNNLLQIDWYKLYQCNYSHVEFTDIITYSPNNLSILTEPEPSSSWSRRAGFTFVDSLGTIRKSYLYNPINTDQYPDKMLALQNGKVLFTLVSNAGRLFGVTDTLQSGFCNSDTLSWSVHTPTLVPYYNTVNLVNSPFNYFKDTAYVYTPKDAELIYVCSTGPTGPLDTINSPPSPTLTSIERLFERGDPEDRFFVQPNPVADFLNITTNRQPKSPVSISIMNSAGKLMMEQQLYNCIFPFKLNVSAYPPGLYVLAIKTVNRYLYKTKFIIARE